MASKVEAATPASGTKELRIGYLNVKCDPAY